MVNVKFLFFLWAINFINTNEGIDKGTNVEETKLSDENSDKNSSNEDSKKDDSKSIT